MTVGDGIWHAAQLFFVAQLLSLAFIVLMSFRK